MKRIALVLVLFVVSAGCFAQDTGSADAKINMLLSDGLYRNYDAIVAESMGLSSEQKYRLYSNNDDDPVMPFVLNFAFGLGIGSFVQKDVAGGLIAIGLDLVGIGATVVGSVQYYSAILKDPTSLTIPTDGLALLLAGTGVTLASRVFQLARPFSYSSRYNRDLRAALQM
jgi:Borrelia membrane protein P13